MSDKPKIAKEESGNGLSKATSPNSNIKLDFASLWEYSDAPESSSHVEIRQSYGLYIDGDFISPEKGRSFKSVNPATETVLTEFGEATSGDVDKAVKAARKAFNGEWSELSAK